MKTGLWCKVHKFSYVHCIVKVYVNVIKNLKSFRVAFIFMVKQYLVVKLVSHDVLKILNSKLDSNKISLVESD